MNILSAIETVEGEGTLVKRLFPIQSRLMNYDPFVLWDHFEIEPGKGFPEHPHRGFEAITYLFNGGIEHKDNLNNQSIVYAGGAQRFTAGKGIVHSELPIENVTSTGIQLWINLPQRLKQINPSYQQVDSENFTEKTVEGVRIKTIVDDNKGISLHTSVQYLDVIYEEDTQHTFDILNNHRGFIYVVDGTVIIDGMEIYSNNSYFFENIEKLNIKGNENSHFMFISGLPHDEPIYQHGTFVD